LLGKEVLYSILIEFGIPVNLVRLIKVCKASVDRHLMLFLSEWSETGDALSPLLCIFDLEYAIMRVRENKQGLKMNGTHQPLVCAVNVNSLGKNKNIIKTQKLY
jgi:hypothetical protein